MSNFIHIPPERTATHCTFHEAPDPNYVTVVMHRDLHSFPGKGEVSLGCESEDCVLGVCMLHIEGIVNLLGAHTLPSLN